MIVATADGKDGKQVIVLGVSRENIRRLTAGQPIRVDSEHHPGFPLNVSIMIVFGETEAAITKMLSPVIGEQTKVVAVPRDQGDPS